MERIKLINNINSYDLNNNDKVNLSFLEGIRKVEKLFFDYKVSYFKDTTMNCMGNGRIFYVDRFIVKDFEIMNRIEMTEYRKKEKQFFSFLAKFLKFYVDKEGINFIHLLDDKMSFVYMFDKNVTDYSIEEIKVFIKSLYNDSELIILVKKN